MGRLTAADRIEQARANVTAVARRLEEAYPQSNKELTALVFPVIEARPEPEAAGVLSLAAFFFMALVGLVLLIACFNVANLLLARASSRQKEIAVRLAMGASRRRLIQQLLTESLLLSLVGGILGLGFAWLAAKGMGAVKLATDIPFALDLGVDGRVLTFTLLLAVITGVVFGLAPALRSSKSNLVESLKVDAGRLTASRQKGRLRNLLIVAQIAVSVVVLITAGLFVRSMQNAQQIDPGLGVKNGLLLSLDPGLQGYTQTKGEAFYKEAVDRIGRLPGVVSASVASPVPLDYVSNSVTIWIFTQATVTSAWTCRSRFRGGWKTDKSAALSTAAENCSP